MLLGIQQLNIYQYQHDFSSQLFHNYIRVDSFGYGRAGVARERWCELCGLESYRFNDIECRLLKARKPSPSRVKFDHALRPY